MKPSWIVLLAVLAASGLGAGVMWHSESTQEAALAQEITKLKSDNTKLTQDVAAAREKAQDLEAESAQLRAARALVDARLTPEAIATPPPEPEKANARGGFLAKMLKNPEMRKMMAAQQTAALRGFYSDFVKQANLTPEEAERFFKLLGDRQDALMESSANMASGGGLDMKAATAATSTAEEALKDLLGPQRFGQYQGFEKTLGDRIQVQQFSQQLGATGAPLQDYQSQALIQIMSQERASLPNFQPANGQQALEMSQEQMDQYSQQVDAMNQRVYNRAMSILTPPQLTSFQTYQKNLAAAQIAGLKMAQQMLKGEQ